MSTDLLVVATGAVVVVAVVATSVYWVYARQGKGKVEEKVEIVKPVKFPNLSRPKPVQVKKDGVPIKILYYSQTGTAEDFSNRLGEELEGMGFAPEVLDVENYEPKLLKDEKTVIFVASTYGEGDPPDNAAEFHRWLMSSERESSPPLLDGVQYAVFGLGNKTYDHFNKVGKDIDSRLEGLGAQRMFQLGIGDDDANLERDFLTWKKDFSGALREMHGLSGSGRGPITASRRQKVVIHEPSSPSLNGVDINTTARWTVQATPPSTAPDQKNPYMAQILLTRELHSSSSDRSCLHIEISTHDVLTYLPGDHLGLFPENDLSMVLKLCSQLKTNPDTVISVLPVDDESSKPIIGPVTLKTALLQYYDISSVVRKPLLRVLSLYTSNDDEKKRLLDLAEEDPNKQQIYDQYIVNDCRCVTEILDDFKSINVPLDHFLEVLPRLQPRYYSISSSPQVHPGKVHITAVLVEYTTPTQRLVKGVTTNWLSTHRADPEKGFYPRIPAFIRKSNFKLPPSSTTPIIMVGPGTGLAPFRGFIQDRAFKLSENQPIGETVLFFGCRHPEVDYIYKEELEGHLKDGAITKLLVAFSRHEDKKVYVQHKLAEPSTAASIWQLINSGAYFYVCGDALHMARDVSDTLIKVISTHGDMDRTEATKYVEKLQADQRYQSDVWS